MKKILIIASVLFFSCTQELYVLSESEMRMQKEITVVKVEDALHTLEEFLNQNNLLLTKSGQSRKYVDVYTYYEGGLRTKSDTGDTISELPTAYVVNFENEEGFAVLGANNIVPDIIAVTEAGSINPVTLEVVSSRDVIKKSSSFFEDMDEEEIEAFYNQVVITADSLLYSVEDDDYYVGNLDNIEEFTSRMIHQTICTSFQDYYTGPGSGSEGGQNTTPSGPSQTNYTEKAPMLNYSWGQSYPFNIYCKRGAKKNKAAYTGCSTTAMAMIAAYNEFPDRLIINDIQIAWKEIKSQPLADSLAFYCQTHIALLMGGIYNFVKKSPTKDYTLITPRQIQKRMKEFGYTDVKRTCATSLTTSMLSQISQMLSEGKPVFISAIPKGILNWGSGHSWVIDGAKYSPGGTYLLHMNFGWRGNSNGYFSKSSLNPAKAYEFDDPNLVYEDRDYVYNWNFRILTYNVPEEEKEYPIDL